MNERWEEAERRAAAGYIPCPECGHALIHHRQGCP